MQYVEKTTAEFTGNIFPKISKKGNEKLVTLKLAYLFYDKNINSFIHNAHLVELYILFLFFTRYHNLFKSGVGFIFAGCLLLGALYGLKKTSKYIKTLEVFHE